MNVEENIENPYISSEEVSSGIRFPYFQPFSSSLFPLPEFVREIKYESHGEVFPEEIDKSHYLDPLPQLANDQYVFHTNTKYVTPQEGIYGKSSAIPLSNDIRKSSAMDISCKINTMEDLFTSWGQLTGPEIRVAYQSPPGSYLHSGGEASAKQRIRWTHELHEQFVDAVNNLGGPMKATPKGILKLMKSPGLTVFHIKSHLQKYRSAKCIPNIQEGRNGKRSICDGTPLCSLRGNGGFHISETLRLQMDVQKSLHEHLEFQKKLQMKIEEHANYLQQMLDQQKRSGSYFENHSSNKANEPFLAECSSATVFGTHGEIFLNDHKA